MTAPFAYIYTSYICVAGNAKGVNEAQGQHPKKNTKFVINKMAARV